MKKKSKFSTLLLLGIIFIGLSLMLYPSISNFWNSKRQSQAIVDYGAVLKNTEIKDYTPFFEEAGKYNEKLAALPDPLAHHETLTEYSELLDPTGTGMMGYVTIDKISVELPVYHGTTADTLTNAVGHLEGSSLPTGDIGTHTIISAHRGLPSSVLFTNLDHLEVGDTFVLTILDKTMTYQVDQIKTVIPSDTQHLMINDKEDYCTLLTCTPYGINTHRLLVRGTRVENVIEKKIYITNDGYFIDTLIVTPAVALPMLLALILYVVFKPTKKSTQRIMREIKEDGENN